MNLSINFEENINRDIGYYQTNPFEILLNGATLKQIVYGNEGAFDRALHNLSDINDILDLNDFAHETSMADIVRFNQCIDNMNNLYEYALRGMQNDYIFGVNKRYAWNSGIYDAIKDIIYYINDFNKRTNNPYMLFRRIRQNEYAVNNFSDAIDNMMRNRDKAKRATGNLVENIEELMDIQTQALENIHTSTEEANQMSPNYNIYNYIDSEQLYTSIGLWTVVTVPESEMGVVKNDGAEVFKMKTPKLVLAFRRQLYKVLSGNNDLRPSTWAHALNGRHPYINDVQVWDHDNTNSSISTHPWGRLCLSAYTDNIERTLGKNDYKSFLMGIMSWNSIYNIEDTNPYNSPAKMFYTYGFPETKDMNKAKGIKSFAGFNTDSCWKEQVWLHSKAERNLNQQSINSSINDPNSFVYGKYVINECDSKECIFREECYKYNSIKTFTLETVMPEMMEAYVGYIYEDYFAQEEDDLTYAYQKAFNKVLQMSNVDDIFNYLEYNLGQAHYWPVENMTEAEQMKQQISNWHNAVNEEGSTHDRA